MRFNGLVKRMKSSLVDLQKAIRGLVVMSIDLEKMFTSFQNNQVPIFWAKIAYLSLKPLGSWVHDLCERLAFY